MAESAAVAGQAEPERYQLVMHVSAETSLPVDDADDTALHGVTLEGGQRLHHATARRLGCGCPYTIQTDGADGSPLHLGRKTRRIRGRLARAVRYRDGGRCRFPGCTNPTTQIHHVLHWADGGRTRIANLVSLCDGHHWLVHEGGWRVSIRRGADWQFTSPGGRATPIRPRLSTPVPPLPHDATIRGNAVSGTAAGEGFSVDDALLVLDQLSSYAAEYS